MSLPVLDEHLGYLDDPVRHAQMREAIGRLVQPGDRVADLGCGSGVLGLLCLQQGAGHVDAIDRTAMLEAARQTFQREGFGNRVRLHAGSTFRTRLEQPVDLLVCDHVGHFGIDYGLLEMLADARERFLKPGGRLLPRRVRLLVAAVGSDACRRKADGWTAPGVPAEFHWLHGHGINAKHAVQASADDLASPLVELAELECGVAHPPTMRWQTELAIERDGPLDGLLGCFRAELAPGVWMTNSPCADDAIRRQQAFLPIADRLQLRAGDRLAISITQAPASHLVAWQVEHLPSGRRYSHSTFAGQLLTREWLARRSRGYRPRLSRTGLAHRTVLDYVDGHRTLAEIESAVLRDHPDLLPSADAIREFIAEALGRDTE